MVPQKKYSTPMRQLKETMQRVVTLSSWCELVDVRNHVRSMLFIHFKNLSSTLMKTYQHQSYTAWIYTCTHSIINTFVIFIFICVEPLATAALEDVLYAVPSHGFSPRKEVTFLSKEFA